jgi:hypothetical protein
MKEWGLCLDVEEGKVVETLDGEQHLEAVRAFVGGDLEGYLGFDVVP